MSWREMRNLTEMMRALDYPRLISIENFRSPNFTLLAEILKWLALRFDSNADVPRCLETEQDRVLFVKMIVHFMASKAFVKLNAKRLYKADGYAVKELLKLVQILYSSMNADKKNEDDETIDLNISELLTVERVKQLQRTRSLASQLTSSGAALHAYLAKEVDLREARNQAIGRQLDSDWVEKCITLARDGLLEEFKQTELALVNVAADEAMLDSKIEKRKNELERNQKRLSTLQSVRPAYMEEYEQLEEELAVYYTTYLTRFRNLAYLENLKEEALRSDEAQYADEDLAAASLTDELRKVSETTKAARNRALAQKSQKQKNSNPFDGKCGDRASSDITGKEDVDMRLGSGDETNTGNNAFEIEDDDELNEDDDEEYDDDDDDDDDDDEEDDSGETDREVENEEAGRQSVGGMGLSIVGNGYRYRVNNGSANRVNHLVETWSPGQSRALQADITHKSQQDAQTASRNMETSLVRSKASMNYSNTMIGMDSDDGDEDDEGGESCPRKLDSALSVAKAETTTLAKDPIEGDLCAYQRPPVGITTITSDQYSGIAPEAKNDIEDDDEFF